MSKRDWETFWSASTSAADPTSRAQAFARKFVTASAAETRRRRDAWASLTQTRAEHRSAWRSEMPGCKRCAGQFYVLKKPNLCGENGGYPYKTQCATCLSRMLSKGWGGDKTFTTEEDVLVCRLLNAHGPPMNKDDVPSAVHFFKSALVFHHHFKTKDWATLTKKMRQDFTTTWSEALSVLPGETVYRGWYNKTHRLFPGCVRETGKLHTI